MSALNEVPLLLRAARGETLDRPPVWMMRQAGRYMKAYRDLREKYPSFRERSEIPEVAIEVSLQPWRAFQPDGVILFSDIVTPMPGLGIDMDIAEGKGPIINSPIRTQQQIDNLQPLNPEESLPFIKTILKSLRQEVGNKSTVLGLSARRGRWRPMRLRAKVLRIMQLSKTWHFPIQLYCISCSQNLQMRSPFICATKSTAARK